MGAVWPYKYADYLRLTLRRQAAHDIRTLPPIWFWRYDAVNSPQDDTYAETPKMLRRYSEPFGVHMYVGWKTVWGPTKGGTDKANLLMCSVTRAELLRVRLILEHGQQTTYRLPTDVNLLTQINQTIEPYVFQPGDIFQWEEQLYQLNDTFEIDHRMGATSVPLTWKGVFNTVHHDSTDLAKPLALRSDKPPAPEYPVRLSQKDT